MQDLVRQIEAALPDDLPARLGVAVSGGGDSMALLVALQRIAKTRGTELFCVTVDHRLRKDSAAEARKVALFCAARKLPHKTLTWQEWDGAGNVQSAARDARYGLMADWARAEKISAIALGHTLNDQAETVVMRLARGAGVDGLSGMYREHRRGGVLWLRPLLDIGREDLRGFLRSEGVCWVDDPSNEDTRFERIKVRQVIEKISVLGIDPATLAQVALNMQQARQALEYQTHAAAEKIVAQRGGALEVNWPQLRALPPEIERRLIVAAIRWINGAVYAPRRRSVAAALGAVLKDSSATLDGCHFHRKGDTLWIFREYHAVQDMRCEIGKPWDDRWRLSGQDEKAGLHVAALGAEGLLECPDWRDTGVPRALLLGTPAVWFEDQLIAAPAAGLRNGWRAELEKGRTSFFDTLISH